MKKKLEVKRCLRCGKLTEFKYCNERCRRQYRTAVERGEVQKDEPMYQLNSLSGMETNKEQSPLAQSGLAVMNPQPQNWEQFALMEKTNQVIALTSKYEALEKEDKKKADRIHELEKADIESSNSLAKLQDDIDREPTGLNGVVQGAFSNPESVKALIEGIPAILGSLSSSLGKAATAMTPVPSDIQHEINSFAQVYATLDKEYQQVVLAIVGSLMSDNKLAASVYTSLAQRGHIHSQPENTEYESSSANVG
jgi:hypothetical protein